MPSMPEPKWLGLHRLLAHCPRCHRRLYGPRSHLWESMTRSPCLERPSKDATYRPSTPLSTRFVLGQRMRQPAMRARMSSNSSRSTNAILVGRNGIAIVPWSQNIAHRPGHSQSHRAVSTQVQWLGDLARTGIAIQPAAAATTPYVNPTLLVIVRGRIPLLLEPPPICCFELIARRFRTRHPVPTIAHSPNG